ASSASAPQFTVVRVAKGASVSDRLGVAGRFNARSRFPQYLQSAMFGWATAVAIGTWPSYRDAVEQRDNPGDDMQLYFNKLLSYSESPGEGVCDSGALFGFGDINVRAARAGLGNAPPLRPGRRAATPERNDD